MAPTLTTTYRRYRGFTLVELMLVLAVVAIIAAIAVPTFDDFVTKNRVKGAAEEIHGLVLQAKSEGPVRDVDMSVSIDTEAWCVGFAETADCDCTDAASCAVDVAETEVTQVVDGSAHQGVMITENFAGDGFTFEQLRGSLENDNSGTIAVASGDWRLDIQVSAGGRIRVCNPNSNAMTGYDAC